MSTMVSNRRSTFGISCVRCDEELIAPDRSDTVPARTSVIFGIVRSARSVSSQSSRFPSRS
jgi:hypothetical protein